MATLRESFLELERELNVEFRERQEEIRALLLCLLARKHLLLIGPPGTAKSALVSTLSKRIECRHFGWLLTKFSTPEEIFGPVSLSDLKAGRYKRLTAGKLPEAETAFLDEVYKASSAILNSMLTVLNEREYHNDGVVMACPLQFAVGASNEFPQGEELAALHDRFLMRLVVNPLADDKSFKGMMRGAPPKKKAAVVGAGAVKQAQDQVAAVDIGAGLLESFVFLRRALKGDGVVASDRRWKESLALVQAAAWIRGKDEAHLEDLEILRHVLWEDPTTRDKVSAVVLQMTNPHRQESIQLLDEARSVWGDTDPRSTGLDKAVEIHTKLKALRAKAQKKAASAGAHGSEFVETETYISERLRELAAAIMGGEEETNVQSSDDGLRG